MAYTEEQKEALRTEVIEKYGDNRYYVLNAEEKAMCEQSTSDFFKGMLKWKNGLSINQYIYVYDALKNKPIHDYKQACFNAIKEAYMKSGNFSPIKDDCKEPQSLKVFVNRLLCNAVRWDWGRSIKKTFYYECLCGDKIIFIHCGRFSKNMKIGQVCNVKGKIIISDSFEDHLSKQTIRGDYAIEYLCKSDDFTGNDKMERRNNITMMEKPVKAESGFSVLL